MPPQTDILITNASAITMDRARPRAEAVALRNGRITFVGSNRQAEAWRGPNTRIIDAQGYTLLPGLIDSHYHLLWGSLNLDGIQFVGVETYEEMSNMLRQYAAANPDRAWLTGFQLSYTVVPTPQRMTRQLLDAIIPDRPLLIMAFDMHTGWANTRALEMAGILHGGEVPAPNEIVMGADGTATGELREFIAYSLVRDLIPKPDETQKRALLRQGLALTASYGITSVHNMDGNLAQLQLYAELEQNGELTARVYVPYSVSPTTPKAALATEAIAMRDAVQSEMVRCNIVKMFMDGVIESFTALMLDPYANDPGNRGAALFEAEHFAEMAIEADRLGLQIFVHAIGDAAIRRTLDGYQLARQVNGRRDSRHRIEHVELLHPADLQRLRQLDVIASMQPLHAGYATPGQLWPENVGAERWAWGFPWQSLREAGVHLAFGSDWPVVTQNPFLGFDVALNRRPLQPGDPEQSQSLHDTLAAYTRAGAYAEFQETVKGELRPGMMADLVLLQGDIEKTPLDEVKAMRAALTICNGRVVYEG